MVKYFEVIVRVKGACPWLRIMDNTVVNVSCFVIYLDKS